MISLNKIWIFANLQANPSLLEILRFQAVGLVIVLSALGLIALSLHFIGRLFEKFENQKQSSATDRNSLEKSTNFSQEEDLNLLVAIIASAVDATMDNSHRIVTIKPVVDSKAANELYLQAWSMEGRREHFASHKIR